jgi:hypothetical protein
MSEPREPVTLPEDLERRLYAFRGKVWSIKLLEAVAGAAVGVLAGYLAVFALDRFTETPGWVRLAAFAVAVAAAAAVPVAVRRWIWGQRGLEQVARLIGRRFPSVGDQLLGIIELVRATEQSAAAGGSDTLRRAAVAQVAEQARKLDLDAAIPRPRHQRWLLAAAVPACLAIAAAVVAPEAAANAWARFIAPWWPVERFTFTRVEPLPAAIVVPHGEPATIELHLAEATRSRPARAMVSIGRQEKLFAELDGGRYAVAVPPQIQPSAVAVAAGDWRQRTRIEPMLRPAITSVAAEVTLPAYLERRGAVRQDVRGGTLVPVEGSTVTIEATADRELAAATVDGEPVEPEGPVVRTPPRVAAGETAVSITWQDRHGLAGGQPLALSIVPRADEPPTVVALDLPASRDILLDTDTLRFRVAVRDDFGIRRVGLEWEGVADWSAAADDPAGRTRGERLLKAGGSDVEGLEAVATFCPAALGISPQPIFLRAFAEDYKPGRTRATSTPLLIYVVDKAEHALVLNTRLGQFRQRASEVRDREMALLAGNKELRELPVEQLLDDDVRARLAGQAAAEEANARRLERLVEDGAKLVQEAMKNPDFEAGTLERLAEDIQALADIAANRMPSVAELLDAAATAKLATAGEQGSQPAGPPAEPKPSGGEPGRPDDRERAAQEPGRPSPGGEQPPQVGEDKSQPAGGQSGEPNEAGQPPIPQVVDKESSQQPRQPGGDEESRAAGQGRLGLPSTQAGVSKPKDPGEPSAEPPADEALDEAIASQEALLAEFAKVSDELAAVMARLEGSTFVKRFKLASREQASIGGRLAALAAEAFVASGGRPPQVSEALGGVRETTARETDKVSALLDDMQAYFDRRQLPAFRTVLEEMKDLDVLGGLRKLSDDVANTAGISIAQAEFWSDTFDRLADDLVPPQDGSGGQGGEAQSGESVPPEVVLETMKILEEEVNLREETRVVQQRKGLAPEEEFTAAAAALADRQEGLADRIVDLVDRLLEEPEGEREFAQEIRLFDEVEEVMIETVDVLASPDTGPKAIAAESEVIELLLAAQAASSGGGGGGGGGGGMTPGGGGTGSTRDSALALVGAGNRTAAAGDGEDEQATGVSGRVLPDEFRAGLDDYFNRLEKQRP